MVMHSHVFFEFDIVEFGQCGFLLSVKLTAKTGSSMEKKKKDDGKKRRKDRLWERERKMMRVLSTPTHLHCSFCSENWVQHLHFPASFSAFN